MASPLRTLAAILGGALLLGFLDQTLERTLVSALAETPPADEASYLAVRNRTGVLITTLVAHTLAALLTGYMLAKIAGALEVRHAIGTAVLVTASYVAAFVGDNIMLPPVWVRAGMLMVTPPALIAGAYVRGQARAIQAEADSSEEQP